MICTEAQQKKINKDNDTQKDPSVFLTGATVAVQREDGGLWPYKVIEYSNSSKHRGQSYTIQVTKTDRLITHKSHMQHHYII